MCSMMSILPLLLTLLLGLASFEASEATTCGYKAVKGVVIRAMFQRSAIKVCTQLKCIQYHCSTAKNCIVAFNNRSGVLFTTGGGMDWTVFVSEELEVKTNGPAALWLLDKEYQGTNLGTMGKALDMMNTTGMLWTSAGPRGAASSRKFANLTLGNRANVQLLQDGKYALDLTQDFTMAVWVKTDDVERAMAIIEGKSHPLNENKTHFWSFPDEKQKQLFVNLGTGHRWYESEIQSSVERTQWRQVAVVHELGSKIQFYMNGQRLGIKDPGAGRSGAAQPRVLQIGHRTPTNGTNDYGQFQGGMACMCIFERALSNQELKQLMTACP